MHTSILRRGLQVGLVGFVAALVVLSLALARITEPSVAADTKNGLGAMPLAEERANVEAGRLDEHGASAKAPCANCGRVEVIRVAEVTSRDGASEKRTAYRVTVRMEDGSFRTISQRAPPSVAVGERVRISDGGVVAAPDTDRKSE
jgi:hypothetical protein